MPSSQDNTQAGEGFAFLGDHALHLPIVQDEVHHLGVKMDLSSCSDDALPKAGDNHRKLVGADMGMGIHENLLRGTVRYKNFKNAADISPLFRSEEHTS